MAKETEMGLKAAPITFTCLECNSEWTEMASINLVSEEKADTDHFRTILRSRKVSCPKCGRIHAYRVKLPGTIYDPSKFFSIG
jgi:Zn finger protein HypA/HybF involved in hydrogenase expression